MINEKFIREVYQELKKTLGTHNHIIEAKSMWKWCPDCKEKALTISQPNDPITRFADYRILCLKCNITQIIKSNKYSKKQLLDRFIDNLIIHYDLQVRDPSSIYCRVCGKKVIRDLYNAKLSHDRDDFPYDPDSKWQSSVSCPLEEICSKCFNELDSYYCVLVRLLKENKGVIFPDEPKKEKETIPPKATTKVSGEVTRIDKGVFDP